MLPLARNHPFTTDPYGSQDAAKHDLLTEPITETILRDIKNIWKKLQYVMLPASRTEEGGILKQWDLWGPLVLCLVLSLLLWTEADYQQKRGVFAMVFSIVWIGATVVTVNAALLGSKISFFQSVCVLGYCLFPLDIAAAIALFIPSPLSFIKLIIVALAAYWACGASASFIASVTQDDRKVLAVYPVCLFYTIVAWLIVLF